MPKQWFVGKTHQGKETYALLNLERQEFESYLPMVFVISLRMAFSRPFLPTYLFIRLDPVLDAFRWNKVNNTFGMKGWLVFGERPQSVPDWVIQEIRDREKDGYVQLPPKVRCKFKKGDRITVRGTGPLEAVFNEVKDVRRAEVFISLLGRPHQLIVPLSKLSPAPLASVVAA